MRDSNLIASGRSHIASTLLRALQLAPWRPWARPLAWIELRGRAPLAMSLRRRRLVGIPKSRDFLLGVARYFRTSHVLLVQATTAVDKWHIPVTDSDECESDDAFELTEQFPADPIHSVPEHFNSHISLVELHRIVSWSRWRLDVVPETSGFSIHPVTENNEENH